MAKCKSCGAVLPEDASYCPGCGKPVAKSSEEFSVSSEDLVRKVKELVRQGNITRIIVKDEKGHTLIEIPVTVGVIGALLAPWLAALGAIAAIVTKCTVVVEKRE
ncbi:DUF4342 domain-containing protein [Candidatus Bipolaricaulota bacterium]|nr:DUF4342 domain-containing protein [Candidatus Bipolaricaulota bacterium]